MNILFDTNRACVACPMRQECEGPVPAEGPMDAEIALIGEAPGRNEDRLGRPWMGAAGQFLVSLLLSVGLKREDIWLSNMSKCRPKGNRTPTTEEAKFCADRWLSVELNMVKPKIIGLLGDVAISYFLGEGTVYERHGKPVIMEVGSWGISGKTPTSMSEIPKTAGSGRQENSNLGMELSASKEESGRHIESRGNLPTDQSQTVVGSSTDAIIQDASDPLISTSETVQTTCETQSGQELTAKQERLNARVVTRMMNPTPDTERMETGSASPVVENRIGRGDHQVVVLPMYHPASGLYDKGEGMLARILEDFQVLGELARGTWKPVVDEYPDPLYSDGDYLFKGQSLALDTEWVDNKLWSVQLSSIAAPGTAVFVGMNKWGENGLSLNHPVIKGQEIIVHSYMADAKMVDLPPNTKDTQVMAYLLGLPQGLKELAKRLCGMEMESYQEVTRKYGKEKAMAYLEEAAIGRMDPTHPDPEVLGWPDPPVLEDAIWNKKNSKFEIKSKTPRHISKKIKRILADVNGGKVNKDGPVDPYDRWRRIDSRERESVEAVLGLIPEGTLQDAPRGEAITYSSRDADATGRIYPILWQQILDKGLLPVFMMDMGTLPIALEMEKNGIKIDVQKLKDLGDRFVGMLQEKSEEIFKELNILCPSCAGVGDLFGDGHCEACQNTRVKRFNPNSNQELATLFFTDLGFTPTKYTKKGFPSVARGELAKIDHPVVGMIEEYRHVQHLKDSFCDTLPAKADECSRVHPTIKTTRTATGRWSMEDPNCQQIPSRDTEGKKIREAFIAEEGNVLVSIDYSQIEMRVQAHVAQCESMIQIFREGRHIHRETCAEIYDIPLADVVNDSPEYKATKNIGYGVMFLETEDGLFTQMKREKAEGWDLARCRAFIKDWYRLRPEVWSWQQETIAFTRRNGYVKDIWGRIRKIPECLVPVEWVQSQGDRQAVNMPIQGGAQGILKQAMNKLWDVDWRDYYRGDPPKWLLQVHDELLWEVWESDVDGFVRSASYIMKNIVKLSVPLEVEVKVGTSWGQMENR